MRTLSHKAFAELKISNNLSVNYKYSGNLAIRLTGNNSPYGIAVPIIENSKKMTIDFLAIFGEIYFKSKTIVTDVDNIEIAPETYKALGNSELVSFIYSRVTDNFIYYTLTLNPGDAVLVSIPELIVNDYNTNLTAIIVDFEDGKYTVSNIDYSGRDFTFESDGSPIDSPFEEGTYPNNKVEFKLTDTDTSEVWFFRFEGYRYKIPSPSETSELTFINSIEVIKDINGTPQENADVETFFDDNIVNPWDLTMTDFKIYKDYSSADCFIDFEILN